MTRQPVPAACRLFIREERWVVGDPNLLAAVANHLVMEVGPRMASPMDLAVEARRLLPVGSPLLVGPKDLTVALSRLSP